MLYAELIEKNLDGEMAVLTDRNGDYTYMQLHKKAMGILAYMRQCGAATGDRVLIRNHNDADTVAAILACLAGGMIFVPVSDVCSEEELTYMREDCSAFLALDLQKEEVFEEAGWEAARDCGNKIPESAGAYILYTSGTEGKKKGVLACQRQIIFCCNRILSRLGYRESDRVLCSLPLEFDYGLYQIFLSLLSRTRLYLIEPGVIQMIPYCLHKWEITIFPSIPSVANLLLKMHYLNREQLPCLRKITFTGEYLPVEEIKALKAILPGTEMIPMYGTTECKRIAVMPEGREDKVMAGSCGLPLDGVTVYFEEGTDHGEGKLIVEGPNVMEGYWRNEEGGFGVNPKTGMRTYQTGDLIAIDEEGFLYFRGRCNGLIKSMGHRISEMEIENLIWKIEGVIECAAVGIHDTVCGEKIGIFVFAHSEEVSGFIANVMSQNVIYKNCYRVFMMTAPLPRNSNGKMDKAKLKGLIHERKNNISGE